jgi:hypothetical protein
MTYSFRKFCPAGTWTELYVATAFNGILWVSASGDAPELISFNFYSANPPFHWNDNHEFGTGFITFPATPLVDVWVNPVSSRTIAMVNTVIT